MARSKVRTETGIVEAQSSTQDGRPIQRLIESIVTSTPPANHAARHAAAGADPVTLTEAQITGLAADLAARVVGPAGATDLRIAVFDAGTGKLIKDGGKTIATVLSDALTAAIAAIVPVNLATSVSGDLPFANLAQIATARLLGRTTAGTGDVEQLTVGAGLSLAAGALKAAAGAVLQVVSATYSTQVSTATDTLIDTGLTATITPASASNKILVLVIQAGVGKNSGNTSVKITLLRDASLIATLTANAGDTGGTVANFIGNVAGQILDSPASTSALVYKTQFSSANNAANAFVQTGSATSSIVLIEIAG